ncbi:MAG: hypothetical protein NC225_02465 [Clostridium sp.]|nr:hypothetical protein [Clostridium sp.]MCM1459009.1 hypothetical protein [Bacteroides sp.]
MGMRMMSKQSNDMVYHRAECRYARKIYKRNRVYMKWEDAESKGYRPCKCCDGAEFLYNLELNNIRRFTAQHNMDIDLKDGKIYVRTDAGCWKIIYKISMQKFILLHRNYVNGRVSLEEADKAPFHRQGDMPDSGSIMKYLNYIQKHDEFKLNMPADYRQLPQDSKKQKTYYRSAKRRAQKQSARRLDELFDMIERKEGIKNLSFC